MRSMTLDSLCLKNHDIYFSWWRNHRFLRERGGHIDSTFEFTKAAQAEEQLNQTPQCAKKSWFRNDPRNDGASAADGRVLVPEWSAENDGAFAILPFAHLSHLRHSSNALQVRVRKQIPSLQSDFERSCVIRSFGNFRRTSCTSTSSKERRSLCHGCPSHFSAICSNWVLVPFDC